MRSWKRWMSVWMVVIAGVSSIATWPLRWRMRTNTVLVCVAGDDDDIVDDEEEDDELEDVDDVEEEEEAVGVVRTCLGRGGVSSCSVGMSIIGCLVDDVDVDGMRSRAYNRPRETRSSDGCRERKRTWRALPVCMSAAYVRLLFFFVKVELRRCSLCCVRERAREKQKKSKKTD